MLGSLREKSSDFQNRFFRIWLRIPHPNEAGAGGEDVRRTSQNKKKGEL
jgi:hypothetical protein